VIARTHQQLSQPAVFARVATADSPQLLLVCYCYGYGPYSVRVALLGSRWSELGDRSGGVGLD
jgi:hypothetical protein